MDFEMRASDPRAKAQVGLHVYENQLTNGEKTGLKPVTTEEARRVREAAGENCIKNADGSLTYA